MVIFLHSGNMVFKTSTYCVGCCDPTEPERGDKIQNFVKMLHSCYTEENHGM